MIKGSHNTFTYLRPKQWWLRPFAFIAKCQSNPVDIQIQNGVRCLDLRVRTNKDGEIEVPHNAFVYIKGKDRIKKLLYHIYLSIPEGEQVHIRVLHEVRNKKQEKYSNKESFENFCLWLESLEEDFPNIKFFGGQRIMDWRQDFVFPREDEIQYVEKHASVAWPKWFHWWPWLYAKLYNKRIVEEYKNKDVVLFYDFL